MPLFIMALSPSMVIGDLDFMGPVSHPDNSVRSRSAELRFNGIEHRYTDLLD
jgi:hypothetical protein